MENKTSSKPPYPSTGQADEVLDLFRRISPKRVDAKFVTENGIATAPNASSVVNFVKWMGIVDGENNVKEDVATKLRLIGQDRDEFIKGLIITSYKEILESVNLQQARRQDLVNFITGKYNYGAAPAKNSAILLLHLCEKYGISVSDELKKKSYTSDTTKPREKKLPTRTEKFDQPKSMDKNGNDKIEGIIIRIPNSGLSKDYTINSREEFENIFNIELKKAEKIIKINFDWE